MEVEKTAPRFGPFHDWAIQYGFNPNPILIKHLAQIGSKVTKMKFEMKGSLAPPQEKRTKTTNNLQANMSKTKSFCVVLYPNVFLEIYLLNIKDAGTVPKT